MDESVARVTILVFLIVIILWAVSIGYTKDKRHAYCFTLKEAFRLTKDCGPEKGIVFEIFSNKFAPDIDVNSKNYKS